MEIGNKEQEVTYPPEYTLEDIFVAIKKTQGNRNIGKTYRCVLKEGPRTYKVAVILEILRTNGSLHHYSLKLQSITANKKGWFMDEEKSIRLEGKSTSNHGEIAALVNFLQTVTEGQLPDEEGKYHVIRAGVEQGIGKLLDMVGDEPHKMVGFLTGLLNSIKDAPIGLEELTKALQSSSPRVVENLAIASRVVTYRRAHDELRRLIEENPSEQAFQDLLGANPWLFGSEYSELLDRRMWTRDQNKDFVMRRTVDGYLEIIEIKRPIKGALFNYDKSHDTYYASAPVSQVVGQVMNYIERAETHRHNIRSMDGEDTLKIRARIILGRDGDERQQEALRTYNAHLHRIEVLTFDQLLRIGGRILSMFEDQLSNTEDVFEPDDDLPF